MNDPVSEPSTPQPRRTLDLRTTKCPLNFVQAKLALEKLAPGDILEVWIKADAESAVNIPQSMRQEGHEIALDALDDNDSTLRRLLIRRKH